MKTAAKVFIILGMVFQCILIYPIVLGIFALKALNNAKKHDDLTAWGIVSLLFVSLLGGIFMLCIKDKDLQDTAEQAAITPSTSYNNSNSNNDLLNAEMYDEL